MYFRLTEFREANTFPVHPSISELTDASQFDTPTWPSIRTRWVNAFRSRDVISGFSLSREVGPEDEWCVEAYMETDYSTLTRSDFERELKRYVAFKLLHEQTPEGGEYEDAD